jgi:hypothetical protein
LKAETALVAAVIDAINKSREAYVFRCNSGIVPVRRGYLHLAPAGTPDVIGWTLRGGRFVGIECKVPGAKTDPERAAKQAETRERIIAAGGIAAQVTDVAQALAVVRGEAMPAAPSAPRRGHHVLALRRDGAQVPLRGIR